MRGSSHFRSVLVCVEYRNCRRTLDVYLLFAILIGEIISKLNYRLVTYKLKVMGSNPGYLLKSSLLYLLTTSFLEFQNLTNFLLMKTSRWFISFSSKQFDFLKNLGLGNREKGGFI